MTTPFGRQDMDAFMAEIEEEMKAAIDAVPASPDLLSVIRQTGDIHDFYAAYITLVSFVHHFDIHRRKGTQDHSCAMIAVGHAMSEIGQSLIADMREHGIMGGESSDETTDDVGESVERFLKAQKGKSDESGE